MLACVKEAIMKKIFFMMCLLMTSTLCVFAQSGTVKGKVADKSTDESFPYVTVVVKDAAGTKTIDGGVTDIEGDFKVGGLPLGTYQLEVSYVGYKTLTRKFTLTSAKPTHTFHKLYLQEDATMLKEVTVTGQQSSMRLEVDRKSFDVNQQIANAGGSASDVLENIPSVEVDNDGNISLRGNESVEVWINGKASGLTTDNRAEILQQLPAESIERIEVIDNPSAKFSAEGSAGIINIVLKKDRKAGYYGSLQVGGNTNGGANASGNINYSSPKFDAYANVGYRHRRNHQGGGWSKQNYLQTNEYQNYDSKNRDQGNNVFMRAGVTWHATEKDDLTLSGMGMIGGRNGSNSTLYHYGVIGAAADTKVMDRLTRSRGNNHFFHGEMNYNHTWSAQHKLDVMVGYNRWFGDNYNYYQDSTTVFEPLATTYDYQYRPMFVSNRSWEAKVDYENQITSIFKLQAGYNGRFSHENTPQESWIDYSSWNGENLEEDKAYFNRFIYDQDTHALYATASLQFGKFGVMGGLRGEYWRVNTESYDWDQEHDATKREAPFKKDFFQLFPSVFISYQLTPTQQLQLNYTRRLRRPWGGQLNSFKNTRDASMVEFGNPYLTPEYSNSFALNYLKQWTEHTLSLSAYYRPTTDVMQRIRYQSQSDGLMYQTTMNVAKNLSTGIEMVLKNRLFKIVDLTTTLNAYYYKINGFKFDIEGQTITGEEDHNFSWTGRMMASVRLPYDISVQLTGNYRSRQVVTQGYRKPMYGMDLGIRKTFFDKQLAISVNVRDLLDSRHFEIFTSSDTFSRHQRNWRGGRRANINITWNFGNMKKKSKTEGAEGNEQEDDQQNNNFQQDNNFQQNNNFGGGEE